MLLDEVPVGALGLLGHEVVIGRLRLLPLPALPQLTDLRLDPELGPAESHHGGVDAVTVAGLFMGSHIDVQGAEGLDELLVQLPQGLWDLARLGHPMLAATLLTGLGRDRCLGHPSRIDGFQRAGLQGTTLLADAPGPELAPQLHELGPV